ncbi:MAG: glycosyltransferase [Planctomycetaceae bacterium]|nr:glycosyltransferase [Planctomycetaceae bacterium]
MSAERRSAPRRVAYLVNQYPKTSHAWIRREIFALEAQGFEIERYSVRRVAERLVDPGDVAEAERTHFLLEEGALALASAVLGQLLRAPLRFFGALRRAVAQGWRSPRGLPVHFVYLAEACLLARHLTRSGAGHLHAHFASNSATVAFLTRALGGPPYSFTFHGPEIFEFPAFAALREKIHGAEFAVAISHHGRSTLMRWSDPAHWPRIHLVHCGIDAGFLDVPRRALPDERRLVCVARLDPVKGHFVLLEALGRLFAKGFDFQLDLVGGGALENDVRRFAAEQGLENRVRFLGWLDGAGVREAVLSARLMVLPSFDEGLPVVFMESYALYRPVLSTYIAGIPELVVPKESGWVVPAGSVDHLVVALEQALRADDATLGAMAERGRREVAEHHDIAGEAAKLGRLFGASLGRGR